MKGDLVFNVADIAGHDSLGRRHGGRRKRLQGIFGHLPEMRTAELLEIVGSEMEGQTRLRLEEEKTAPDGTPWEEWSEGYAERRRGSGGLLELEGHLLDSITYNVGTGEVALGSNLAYARRHQEGDKRRGKEMPRRQYLGLSTANIADIQGLVLAWVSKELLS